MNAKLVGLITDIFPTETPNPNFVKRVFWVKQPDTERHPQHWEVELHGDDCKRLEGFKIGDKVEVEVEIRGRKWTNPNRSEKIFTSLKATGLLLLNRAEIAPGPVSGYKPRKKEPPPEMF